MNLNQYTEKKEHRLKQLFWRFINHTLFRCILGAKLYRVRNSILKIFGADIEWHCMIYPSCTIWAPWNLKVGKYTCIGPDTFIYNKDKIEIGSNSVVSQGSYLCTASHDTSDPMMTLVTKPITLGDRVWVASECFIGPGVTLYDGVVCAARAVVVKDVEAWTIVGGNPAKFLKKRVLKGQNN